MDREASMAVLVLGMSLVGAVVALPVVAILARGGGSAPRWEPVVPTRHRPTSATIVPPVSWCR
jgi:hypothetical protein